MRSRFWIAAAWVFLLLPLGARAQQTQQGQSLADAAKKEREHKKNAPKAAKVFTNDNIPTTPGIVSVVGTPGAPAEGENTTSAKKKGAATETAEKPQANGEAYWRKRFGEVHTKLRQAQTELDIMQRELSQLQEQYYPDPQKTLMQGVTRGDINEKRAKIDAKQKEIQGLQRQLSDLEDELRKSGGDPGWASE